MRIVHPAVEQVACMERLWMTGTHPDLNPNKIALDRAKLIVSTLISSGMIDGFVGSDMMPYRDTSFNGG